MELPTHLINQIKDGNVCLVLGAGCSTTSSNLISEKIPSTTRFCEIVCEAAGVSYSGENPKDVFQAVRTPSGTLSNNDLKKLFIDHFTDCIPSDEMNGLVSYSWRRIYTFNIDDVLRNTKRTSRAQNLRPINALREGRTEWRNFTECQIIHLHGYAGEFENGIVFTREEYAKELHKREGWYESIGEDFSNHTLLVVGSTLDEPILEYHMTRFAESYSDAGRSYFVAPNTPTTIRRMALENMGFLHLEGTVETLVGALARALPQGLPPAAIRGPIATDKQATLTDEDIEGLRSFYPIDRASIAKVEAFQKTSKAKLARKFFDGYGPDTFTVASGIPATLKQDATLESNVWQALEQGARGVCILGEAGSGKSTFSYKVLMNNIDPKALPVYLYKESATPISMSLLALERYIQNIGKEYCVVLIDDLHIYSEMLGELFTNNRLRKVRILTSSRKSEWHSRIRRAVGPDIKVLEYKRFESGDIESLIDQISTYYPSPSFTKLSHDDKYRNFRKSKRQLLVALREATSSEVFDDTIRDEFERIGSEGGRLLLAVICWATVARVGVSKGACQSIYSKLDTRDSFQDAVSQLEGIAGQNAKGRLVARHELYADFIVESLLNVKRLTQTLEAYFKYFSGFEMPVIQRVDRLESQLFKYSLSNKNIYRIFSRAGDVDAGFGLFERYSVEFQLDGHFWLQQALYLRRLDKQHDALKALEVSIEAYKDNVFARHALAQQKLIVASLSDTYGAQERKRISEAVEELREQHEMTSSTPWRVNSEEYPIVTLANHHVDALYRLGQIEDAQKAAASYFNEIEEFSRKAASSSYLDSTRERLMKIAAVGKWDAPSRRTGQIDFL